MKRKIVILCLLLATGVSTLVAQTSLTDEQRKARFEKFKAERIDFISKAMQMSEAESAAFWPLDTELFQKKFELNRPLRAEMRAIRTALRNKESVADETYKKVVELSAQIKLEEARLEQEYLSKFLAVISAEKMFAYQQADKDFGRQYINNHPRGGNNN